MIQSKHIEQLDSMYPSTAHMIESADDVKVSHNLMWASIYGYSYGDSKIIIGNRTYTLEHGQYFSLFCGRDEPIFSAELKLFVVARLGYKCQNTLGWVEKQGRLSYIDGCTDSLLIYPPRMGDPSLNLLHFPAGIEQTRHLHPSIRMGCVISGNGFSEVWESGIPTKRALNTGDIFCLEENELHRFITTDNHMTVIAWHPDGDWGPTDHNHTMLNRTYIK